MNDDAELYIRLFPYILKDFLFKEDYKNSISSFLPDLDPFSLIGIDSSVEGIKKALLYKSYLDSGDENLDDKIKPVINT